MALTKAQVRELLSTAGCDAEKVADVTDKIIEGHITSIEALREERDNFKKDVEIYKRDADKLAEVQKELDEVKDSKGKNIFEAKYNEMKEQHDKLKAEFDQYKADIDATEAKRTKESAYRKLLKESNVQDKRIDSIMRVSDLEAIELDKDGKFKDEENLKKIITEEWGDFIVKEHQEGAEIATPPGNNPGVPKGESRAAKIAAQYHANLYGENPKEGK